MHFQPWVAALPGALPPAPAAADLNVFLAPLLATVTRQVDAQEVHNNILHTQVEHMVEKSEKNRVKHLHESTIKMFLFASAMDNESVPTELTESCKRIINSKTVALASAGDELSCTSCAPPFHIFSYSSGVVSTSGEAAVHILCTLFLCDREGFLIWDSFGRGSLCWDFLHNNIFCSCF